MGVSRVWCRVGAVAGVVGGFLSVADDAGAQTQLPQIVVTSPSPIVPRAPAEPASTLPETSPSGPSQPSTFPIVDTTFVPVTVVTAQEINRTPASTLGDLLFDKPGVTASTFAPGAASRPIIRGLDNFRVRIQENGVAAMDVSDLGEDHGVPIDPLAANQVEVVRGPATLRWGSQAIGGVVDVTNNRIPDVLPRGLSLITKGAVSSVDKGYEGATIIDAGGRNVAVHADFYGRNAEDYNIPGGTQPNSAMNALGQAFGTSYFFDGGYVGAAIAHFTSLYRIPGTESAATNTRINLEQTKMTSKGEWRPNSSAVDAVRFWLGATDYKHDEIGLDDAGIDGVRATFKNREQEGRIEVQLAPLATSFGPLTSALGLQIGHQELGTSGDAGGLLAPNQTTSVAGYVFNELKLSETLKLQAAGRIESVSVNGTAAQFPADYLPDGTTPAESERSRNLMPISASLGLLQNLPWNMVGRLTGQYVERAPRAAELFSKGSHDAPGTFEIGNPDLKIESAKTVEVGLSRKQGTLRFDATGYYTQFSNFIFKRLTGNRCGADFDTCGDPAGELIQIVYSQADATFYGAELSAQLDVMPLAGGVFGIDGQYDFVRARFADGTNVPRIPPQRLGGGLFWRDASWFARVGLLHAFAQNDVAVNETPTDGYDNLKAELSYTRKMTPTDFGPREMTVGITGTNLLDADMRNHVSFRKDEVLLPGRNVRLFATVRF